MIHIRKATPEDRDAIWEIFHEVVSAGDTYAFPPGIGREEGLRLWTEATQAAYVAELDGRVAGTYYIKPNQPGPGSHVCNAGYSEPPENSTVRHSVRIYELTSYRLN